MSSTYKRNPTKEEVLTYLRKHKETLFSTLRLSKLGLFGSIGYGEVTDASDIDLMVEFLPDTPDLYDKKSQLRNLIQTQFNRDVDICREKYMKPWIKDRVFKNVIYV